MVENQTPTLRVATPQDIARAEQKQQEPKPAAPVQDPPLPPSPPISSQTGPQGESGALGITDQNPSAIEGEKKDDSKSDEKPKRKRIKEISKPFFEHKAAPVEAKPDDIPEPLKAKISEYEKKIAEYESRLNKSTYKIVDEAEKAGKTIFDLFEEYRTEDISKLSDTQLYERELMKAGVKPAAELDPESTDTSLEEEMEKFRAMTKIAQKREVDSIRKEYTGNKDNRQNEFLSKLTAENQRKAAERQSEAAEQERVSLKAVEEYNALCDAYVGKEHYSVVGTPQMAESLKNILQDPINGLIGRNQDGSIDAESLFDLAHYKLFRDLRQENLENQFFSQGYETFEKIVEAKGGEQKIVRAPKASSTNAPTELRAVSVGHPSVHV